MPQYRLVFGDGTELTGLKMNATTIISQEDVNELLNDEKAMREVHLYETDEMGITTETVYEYANSCGAYLKEDGWNFTLWGTSPDAIELKKLREENQMLEDALVELAELIGG